MLKAIAFAPGVDRENTDTSNEGRWVDGDKVRFRGGKPEKIGGWMNEGLSVTPGTLQPPVGVFWGICRNLINWLTLNGNNLLGIGTHLKYYIENGGAGQIHDIT